MSSSAAACGRIGRREGGRRGRRHCGSHPRSVFSHELTRLRPKTETMTLQEMRDIMHSKDIAIIDVRPKMEFASAVFRVDPYVLCSACSACSAQSAHAARSDVPLSEIVADPGKFVVSQNEAR